MDGLTHLFPAPAAVAGADLTGMGITPARGESLRALARAVASGSLTLDRGANREETIRQLEAVPGIGPWTSAYVAMRALGDPDAFPATDLALRRAAIQFGLGSDVRALQARAETWRPWRSYAAMYLWNSLTNTTPLEEQS